MIIYTYVVNFAIKLPNEKIYKNNNDIRSFILVLIQIIWLYSSYQFNKNEIVFKTSHLLENAIDAETFSRLSSLPQGTMVKSRPQSDSGKDIPEFAYMQESLDELGKPISLDTIAKYYKQDSRRRKY